MDESKQQESTYAGEPVQTASVGTPSDELKQPEFSHTAPTGPLSLDMLKEKLSGLLEGAGDLRGSSLADFAAYLKRTWRLWLTAATVVFGMLLLISLTEHVFDWVKNARERRHEQAVASVTPDRLIARCGPATEDVTKEVFPIVMRTMSYRAGGDRQLVVAFSRTAEQQSDWVFLAMNDQNGGMSYNTPDEQIAALPCLDSRK